MSQPWFPRVTIKDDWLWNTRHWHRRYGWWPLGHFTVKYRGRKRSLFILVRWNGSTVILLSILMAIASNPPGIIAFYIPFPLFPPFLAFDIIHSWCRHRNAFLPCKGRATRRTPRTIARFHDCFRGSLPQIAYNLGIPRKQRWNFLACPPVGRSMIHASKKALWRRISRWQ